MIKHINHKKLQQHSIKPIIGIYFLYNRGSLIYIGKSTDIFARIQQHKIDKIFDSFAYKECQENLLNEIEKETIKKYGTKLNVVHNVKLENRTLNDYLLNSENFKLESGLYPVPSAFLFQKNFIAKTNDGELIISKIKTKKNRYGKHSFEFRDLKGEIITNGSVYINAGWFKHKRKTFYFKQNVTRKFFDLECT